MIDFMEANYEEIVAHNCTHNDYTMQLFNALLTSKNDIFRSMIQRLNDAWEIVENVEPGVLIEATLTEYNNMVKQNIWDQKDPKGTIILALTTKLEVLESAFNTASNTPYKGGTRGGGGSQNKNKGQFIMPD